MRTFEIGWINSESMQREEWQRIHNRFWKIWKDKNHSKLDFNIYGVKFMYFYYKSATITVLLREQPETLDFFIGQQ